MKKQNGITLIALVITVIVMSIIVVAAVSMVIGDEAVINQALSAKDSLRGADIYEYVEIVVGDNSLASELGLPKRTKADVLAELYEAGKISDAEKADIEEDWKITIGDIETDFNKLDGNDIEVDGEIESDQIELAARLHSDFNGTACNIYMENFGKDALYARFKMSEYMEVGKDAGVNLNLAIEDRSVALLVAGSDYNNPSTWPIRDYSTTNAIGEFIGSSYGGYTTYMPTFNMDKDNLTADVNGTYDGTNSSDIIYYDDYVMYTLGEELEKDGVTHVAKQTESAQMISMSEWESLSESDKENAYWVYDTDGWVYYSKPIEADTATGCFLNKINLIKVPDDNYYYTMNVVVQYSGAGEYKMTEADWTNSKQQGVYNTIAGIVNVGGR